MRSILRFIQVCMLALRRNIARTDTSRRRHRTALLLCNGVHDVIQRSAF